MALARTDTDKLALAVDIPHPQVDELGNPQPGGIVGTPRLADRMQFACDICAAFRCDRPWNFQRASPG
jgi:hypothetical protein